MKRANSFHGGIHSGKRGLMSCGHCAAVGEPPAALSPRRGMSKRRTHQHRAPKVNEIQVHERISELLDLIGRGRGDRRTLLQHAAKNWNVGTRQGDEYIARARACLRDMHDTDIAEARAELMAWNRDIYKSARDKGDLKSALAAGRELAKLLDLYPKQDSSGSTLEITASDKTANILRDVYKPDSE